MATSLTRRVRLRRIFLVDRLIPILLALSLPSISHGDVVISEFLAINSGPELDNFNVTSDWIELHNNGNADVVLSGWTLSDEVDSPSKWIFPAVTIRAGGYLAVWASGRDVRDPAMPLHTNFTLSGEGEYLALRAPNQTTSTVFNPYPKQFARLSYGSDTAAQPSYRQLSTREARNAGPIFTDFVRDTEFSVQRGFYTTPFSLAITSQTQGAEIRYTTDFSEPTETSTLYAGPLSITTTSVVRAKAFRSGQLPTNVDTQSYIFAETWKTQPEAPAGFPLTWGASSEFNGVFKQGADYLMRPAVTGSPIYEPLIIPALTTTLPVLCVTGESAAIMGDSGLFGTLRNSTSAELSVGIEYFDPGAPGQTFSKRGNLQMHGGIVRRLPKRGLRLDFSTPEGSGPLRFPLFAGSPVESFDQLVLRPGAHDSFVIKARAAFDVSITDHAFHATLMRDQFIRRVEQSVGIPAPRSRYVHLCLNGLYWGIYDLLERPNAEFFSEYGGGTPEEWDVIHHGPQTIDGTATSWEALLALATAGDVAALTRLAGTDQFIDHMLIRMWAGDHDWLSPVGLPGVMGDAAVFRRKNWYAGRQTRSATEKPWVFFTWDAEMSMGLHALFNFQDGSSPKPPGLLFPAYRELRLDMTGVNDTDSPGQVWAALVRSPEFVIRVGDRARALLYRGALSPTVAPAKLAALLAELDLPIVAETARWGASAGSNVANRSGGLAQVTSSMQLTRDNHWRPEAQWLRDTWCVARTPIFIDQLKARGLYPALPAADYEFGSVDPRMVTLTVEGGGSGQIKYTLDGSDPITNPSALTYTGALTPAVGTPLKVRVFNGAVWSALTVVPTNLSLGTPTREALVITEVHYHPSPPTAAEIAAGFTDADDFEYLELTNLSAAPVALSSLRFAAGIDFDFATGTAIQQLPAGGSLLLASNLAAFTRRYGLAATGEFQNDTNLSNSGETIKLVTSGGEIITEFTYNDRGAWPVAADGRGSALTLRRPQQIQEESSKSWRAGAPSPGTIDNGDVTYMTWLQEHFTTAEIAAGAITGGDNDPDKDGIPNSIEYLTLNNPLEISENPVTAASSPGQADFRWELRVDAASQGMDLETSSDLRSWQKVTTPMQVSVSPYGTTILHHAPPAAGLRFARLRSRGAP